MAHSKGRPFPPGKSGNPKGRPVKSETLWRLAEAWEPAERSIGVMAGPEHELKELLRLTVPEPDGTEDVRTVGEWAEWLVAERLSGRR